MPCPNSARKRSKTMAFRMTPEEYEEVITLAKLSGMNRQDFIMSRLRGIEITVEPSTRVYKALKDSMAEIYLQLLRIRAGGELNPSMEATIRLLAEIFVGLDEGDVTAEIDEENDAVWNMERG